MISACNMEEFQEIKEDYVKLIIGIIFTYCD